MLVSSAVKRSTRWKHANVATSSVRRRHVPLWTHCPIAPSFCLASLEGGHGDRRSDVGRWPLHPLREIFQTAFAIAHAYLGRRKYHRVAVNRSFLALGLSAETKVAPPLAGAWGEEAM